MPQIGISIEKQAAFRDSVQPWSNVYHYAALDDEPDEGEALALIDEVVAFEKSCHSTQVTFLKARCWSSGGTIAQNQMIAQKTLTGTGTTSTTSSFDRERAYLVQWDAGISTRGQKVKLKKWFHACGFFGAHTMDDGKLQGTTGFSAADRTAIANKADEITRIGPLERWGLVAESGRERDGGPPVAHKYLEHHQLGEQWRS